MNDMVLFKNLTNRLTLDDSKLQRAGIVISSFVVFQIFRTTITISIQQVCWYKIRVLFLTSMFVKLKKIFCSCSFDSFWRCFLFVDVGMKHRNSKVFSTTFPISATACTTVVYCTRVQVLALVKSQKDYPSLLLER